MNVFKQDILWLCWLFIQVCLSGFLFIFVFGLLKNEIIFFIATAVFPPRYLGCVPDMSHTIKGELCVNVNKSLFPKGSKKTELIEFVIGFTQKVVSMEDIYWRTLIIKSHLIGDGFREVMKTTLDKCNDVTFTYGPWKMEWDVQVMLNFVYGGITRYRLLSFRKHANGFKVHKVGSYFTIQRVEGRA